MILGDDRNSDASAPEKTPDGESGDTVQFYVLWRDIFKFDMRFWFWAIARRWLLIVITTVFCAVLALVFRIVTAPRLYTATCAMVRQEISTYNQKEIPAGYTFPGMNVVLSMMVSRKCGDKAVSALNLNWADQKAYKSLNVEPAAKHSNYILISATTTSPSLSARYANKIAEVFVDQYTEFINDYMHDSLNGIRRNQAQLKNEIDALQIELKKLCEVNQIFSFDVEMATIGQRIILEEDRYNTATSKLTALKTRQIDLKAQLGSTPPRIESYVETGVTREQEIQEAEVLLAELRKKFTDQSAEVRNQLDKLAVLRSAPPKNATTRHGESINPAYSRLETEIFNNQGEINSTSTSVDSSRKQIENLKIRRDVLNAQAPAFNALTEKIKLKKDAFNELETKGKSLDMFISRRFSDITIHETAQPPSFSNPTKRPLFTLGGAIFGLFAALLAVLAREALIFTVRSKIDLEQSLHLPAIGMIPELHPEYRNDYYSAMHAFNSAYTDHLKRHPGSGKALVAMAPVGSLEGFQTVLDELFEIASINSISYVRIRPAPEDLSASTPLVNDYIYCISDTIPKPKNNQLYFKLDDMAFMAPPSIDRLRSFVEGIQDCQIVMWELFPFDENSQLYADICRMADMTILPLHYNSNSKWYIARILKLLRRTCSKGTLFGLLYAIDNKVYRRLNQ